MALLGYRKAGTDDTRCLAHVDFVEGSPVYTAFECTYCGEEWAKGLCVPAEDSTGETITLHADGCEHVEVRSTREYETEDVEDTRPMKGAFHDSRMHGWVMIHNGDYYGTYMGGSEAGARAALRNLRRRAETS